jgi:endo-1,4-beta-xylanase
MRKLALLASTLLAACGGGGGSTTTFEPPAGPTLRSLAEGRILIGTAVAATPEWHSDALHTDAAYAALLADQYNVLVPENVMKFDQVETAKGVFDFTNADAVVTFAQAHDMVVRGHCLLWHQQSGWLWDGNWNIKSPITADQLPGILQNHVHTVVDHFKGKIAYWDVVNEAIEDGLGSGKTVEESLRDIAWAKYYPRAQGDKKYKWIADAFTYAHAADPDAKLFYNEYGDEGLNGWGHKADYTYNLVKQLLDDGVPVHGVGMQMHIDAGGYPLNDSFAANLKRFTDLGLEVHITELDVRIPTPVTDAGLAAQKAIYKQLLAAALANPKVTAVLTWGLDDGHSWVPGFYPGFGAALPFDQGYGAKPAFYGLQEALQE